jgi:hypothetical protein
VVGQISIVVRRISAGQRFIAADEDFTEATQDTESPSMRERMDRERRERMQVVEVS